MITIAHIINPVLVDKSSDLHFAQPVTFKTMKAARESALNEVELRQYVAYYPEDFAMISHGFRKTKELNRSILNCGEFLKKKKLPLIGDILKRLFHETSAEYLIYTNVDIALMPHFYLAVKKIIEQGYDGFVINRRTISNQYATISEIPLMMADMGESHIGHDCFIFHRDMFPKFILGKLCIGVPYVGRSLVWNIAAQAKKYKEFKESHLTFHIGKDRVWKNSEFEDYTQFNKNQAKMILEKLQSKYNAYDKLEKEGLFDGMDFSKPD